jgi:hypothetical protein
MSFTVGSSIKIRNPSDIPLVITAHSSMASAVNLTFPPDDVTAFAEDYILTYANATDILNWKRVSDFLAPASISIGDNGLVVNQTTDNTTTTNKLAAFTSGNVVVRTDLTYSDILRLSTAQTITGVKTFSNSTLVVSQTADDTTATNKVAFFDATNIIQRGAIVYSDIMRLATAQSITAQKTFVENAVKLTQTASDTTGTNLLLAVDATRQVRWTDLTYSDILRLSTAQTVSGVKTFSNNTLVVSQTADNTTTTNKLAMFTSGNVVDRSDLVYSDILRLSTAQTVSGVKTFIENAVKLTQATADATGTNLLVAVDATRQVRWTDLTYSDILRLSTAQTVSGVKTFSNNTLVVSQTVDNTTTANKLAVFTSGNVVDRSDLVYSDILRLSTAQTVSGVKTFSNNTLLVSQTADDTTVGNKVAFFDATNIIQRGSIVYSDIMRLATAQSVSAQKTFVENAVKLTQTASDATGTNLLLAVDATRQVRWTDLTYSDILRLSTAQTITGVKTFSNNTLVVSQTVDNTTTTNKLAMFTSGNVVDRSDLVYSDILRLSTAQTVSGVKTFSNNTLIVNQTADNVTTTNKIALFDSTNTLVRGTLTYAQLVNSGDGGTYTLLTTFNNNTLKVNQSADDTTGTNKIAVFDATNVIHRGTISYSDIMLLASAQTVTAQKTFNENQIKLVQAASDTTGTNLLLAVDATRQVRWTDLTYSDILRLSTAQTVSGVKTFSNNTLVVSQTVDNTTTTNKLAMFTGTNVIDRSDLVYSDILRLSTAQTVSGVKTFSNNTLLVSQTADDTTVGNKVAFFNATNVIQRGSIVYSDIMRLATAQTVTAQKTFVENAVKLTQATADATGTNLLVAVDATRQVRWTDLTYSDILRLSTAQTVSGVKTFSNNTLVVSQTADDTTVGNKVAFFDATNTIQRGSIVYSDIMRLATAQTVTTQKTFNENQLKLVQAASDTTGTNLLVAVDATRQVRWTDLTYSDILRLSTAQAVSGVKTFANNTLVVSQTTDNTTTTNKLAMFTSGNVIDRSDLVYSDIMRLSTAQTVTGQKTFNENTIKMVQAANDTTDANKILVSDATNQVRWSGKTYADIRHNAKPSLTLLSGQAHNLNLQTADTTTASVTFKFPAAPPTFNNTSIVTATGNDTANIYNNFKLQYNKTTTALSFVEENNENRFTITVGSGQEYTTVATAVARANVILAAQLTNAPTGLRGVLIKFLPGTYAIANPIVIQPGTFIAGDGDNFKLVKFVGTVNSQPIFSLRPETTIENVTVVGNNTQQAFYFRQHETESNMAPCGIHRVQVINALRFIEAEITNTALGYLPPRLLLNDCFFVATTNVGTTQYDKIFWAKTGAYIYIVDTYISNMTASYTDIGTCLYIEGTNAGNGSTVSAFPSTIFYTNGSMRYFYRAFFIDNNALLEMSDVKFNNLTRAGEIGANGTTSTIRFTNANFYDIQDRPNGLLINNADANISMMGTNINDLEDIKYNQGATTLYTDVFSRFEDKDDTGFFFRGMVAIKPAFRNPFVTAMMGEGYCTDIRAYTVPNTATPVYTDVLTNLQYRASPDVTVTNAVNSAVYFGGREKFSSLFILLGGGLTAVDAAKIIPEYWNGTAWTTFRILSTNVMNSQRISNTFCNTDGGNAANVFNLLQFVRFGPLEFNWATTTIQTYNYYWVRFRINTALTTNSLSISKLKIIRDLMLVAGNGHIEYFGKGRCTKQLLIPSGSFAAANNPAASVDVYYSDNLNCGMDISSFVGTVATVDSFGAVIPMAMSVFDNTFPIKLTLYFVNSVAITAGNAVRFNVYYKLIGEFSDTVATRTRMYVSAATAPTTGVPPESQTGFTTTTFPAAIAIHSVIKTEHILQIDSVLPTDTFIFVNVTRNSGDVLDTFNGDTNLIGAEMHYVAFAEGEQISTVYGEYY